MTERELADIEWHLRSKEFCCQESEYDTPVLVAEVRKLRAALNTALNEWEYAAKHKGEHPKDEHSDNERIQKIRDEFGIKVRRAIGGSK